MGEIYTTISLTGGVATLLSREAIVGSQPATAGNDWLYVAVSDTDANPLSPSTLKVLFEPNEWIQVGTEKIQVDSSGLMYSDSLLGFTSPLLYNHPTDEYVCHASVLYVSTGHMFPTSPGSVRVGMEVVSHTGITAATDKQTIAVSTRGDWGTEMYAHTEWAPVTDASFTVNNPATDSEIGRWGVIEDVDYHHGALDRNTLDIYALDKLMEATRPQYGRVEMTGMDVWQDAYYANKKDITYYVDSPTSFATVRFEMKTTTGTDSATTVYIGDTIQKTWWDVRFATSTDTTTTSVVDYPSYNVATTSTSLFSGNQRVYSFGVCGATIYAGTDTDGEIYNVSTSPPQLVYTPARGSYVTCMATYGANLYAGSDVGDLFMFDGSTWSLVSNWGFAANMDLRYLVVNGSTLYLVYWSNSSGGAAVIRTYDGSTFTTIYSASGYHIYAPAFDGDTLYFLVETYAAPGVEHLMKYEESVSEITTITYNRYANPPNRGVVYDGTYYLLSGAGVNNVKAWDGDAVVTPFSALSPATLYYGFDGAVYNDTLVISGCCKIGATYNGALFGWNGDELWVEYVNNDEDYDEYSLVFQTGTLLYTGVYDRVDRFTVSATTYSETTTVPGPVTYYMQPYYLRTYATDAATVWLKIKDPATGGATVSMYFGSPMAIDYTMTATPVGFTVATLGSWSATSTGTFNIGDRGFATVREGDPVNVVELDGATRDYRVSGMIYDQRAGTLTMEIGKPYEGAITDMVKPFRTRDILSTRNL